MLFACSEVIKANRLGVILGNTIKKRFLINRIRDEQRYVLAINIPFIRLAKHL